MKMKFVKKIGLVTLGFALVFGFSSCSSKKEFNAKKSITVLSREEGSGTRGAFIELFGIEKKDSTGKKVDYTTTEAMITNSTAVMTTSVSSDLYAIGYVSLGFLNPQVKGLQIDSVKPTVENIKSGKYKIVRPFNIVINPNELSESAKDFISFILSKQGQQVLVDNGFIDVSSNYEYLPIKTNFEKVVIAGSSSISPVMEKIKEVYEVFQPNAKIEIQQSDSSTGISSVKSGVCDIGMSSRDLKSSEKDNKILATIIAQDGIAVIVNQNNPVTNLSSNEICEIFTGNILEWENLIEK